MRIGFWLIFMLVMLNMYPLRAQDAQAWDILTLVNQARAESTSPLLMSAELVAAAQAHSDDMARDDFLGHQGSDGSTPAERVSAVGYNWTQLGENVLYRFDLSAQGAFDQWWNSRGHRENLLNPEYIEVGIAWAQSVSGKYYYTMVLASRSEVGTPIPGQRAGLFPSPTSTAGFTATLLPIATATSTLQPTLSSSTASATATAQIIVANSPTPNVVIVTPPPTMSATVVALAPTIAFSTLPPPTSVPDDLRLVFDQDSFTLINVSGRALDLRGLSFQSVFGSLDISRWDTPFLTAPLSAFPPQDCLQGWDLNITQLPVPDVCDTRHAWIAINQNGQFWRGGDAAAVFMVNRPEGVIATCEIWRGSCGVNLSTPALPSAQATANTSTSGASATPQFPAIQAVNAASSSSAALTILYSSESMTIINTSSGALNLSGLSLSGSEGVLNISAWDNGFLSAPLDQFPPNDCLQVWDVGQTQQPAPAQCETRHAWIAVNDTADVWRDTFTIAQNGTVLGTCQAEVGACEVDLP